MSDRATGNMMIMGQIEVVNQDEDNYKTDLGILLVFNTVEQLRQAIREGVCNITFGYEEVDL